MKALSLDYLNNLKPSYLSKGYSVPKWIIFSEQLIQDGWVVDLIRSKSTVSKYIYISKDNKKYKIRFSNHKANVKQENKKDCDFYVGVGNNGIITTDKVLKLVKGEN